MFHRAMLRVWAVLFLGILAACGNQPVGSAPTASTSLGQAAMPPTRGIPTQGGALAEPPTVAVMNTPTLAATHMPSPAPTDGVAQVADSAAIPDSVTPEGYHVLGHPDAAVTMVMYSDFL